ncbi:MAG: hypothetical protein SynsKO_16820 [Synoicihabitans sp.]
MKWFWFGALLSAAIAPNIRATESVVAGPAYTFSAVEILVKTTWGDAPVVSAGRWGLKADTAKGIKRFGYAAPYRIKPKIVSGRNIIEVRTFDIGLSYARQNQLEAHAMMEVQQHQIATDIAISDIARSGVGRSMAAQTRIDALRDEYQEFESNIRDSIEGGDFESTELNDTIHLTVELFSPEEITDAFCVFTIRYNIPNPRAPNGKQFISIARIRRVGDLPAQKPKKVKMNFRVPGGYLDKAFHQFHLLSGDIENLATTKSPGLKVLPQEVLSR